MKQIEILDTTLRDGAQGEGIAFSLRDKLAVTEALDELGIAWIEAGNPASNPKDLEFFQKASSLKLKHSKLCAFGATRKKLVCVKDDPQIKALLEAGTEGVCVFGKSWDLHVKDVLQVSPEENLAMIAETLEYLKQEGRFVIYDAEHFFDGFSANREYALSAIKTAFNAGADRIVLCDTNGGTLFDNIKEAVTESIKTLPNAVFGIHAHNDCGLALANTIAAVNAGGGPSAGCTHVQGTLVGFGERCGNTCLASLIPTLELKWGMQCLPKGKLQHIGEITRRIAEIANVTLSDDMPYIGTHAFSHKGGMHSDGIIKNEKTFEHINPSDVGNKRRLLLSELGGRSAIAERVKKVFPDIQKDHPLISALSEKIKKLEAEGMAYEGADASFEILIRKEFSLYHFNTEEFAGLGPAEYPIYKPHFNIEAYRVLSEHPVSDSMSCSHAWVKVLVDGQYEIAAAEGVGPVGALDSALRRALTRFFPSLEKVRLEDYKVRVIDGKEATNARVRVLIESTDGQRSWNTVGVSKDIIDASRAALVDSIEYMLING